MTSAEKSDCALRGDFLELDDLADPQSPFSSSFNSSCPTLASEELFDSEMLLQELEDKRIDRKEQFKYTISGTVKSNEVVMHPAIVGMCKFLIVHFTRLHKLFLYRFLIVHELDVIKEYTQ